MVCQVPGDVCEGGWLPPKVEVPCPAHSPVSRGGKISLLLLLAVVVLMFVFNQLAKSGKLKALLRNSGDCHNLGGQDVSHVIVKHRSFKYMSFAILIVHLRTVHCVQDLTHFQMFLTPSWEAGHRDGAAQKEER